MSSALDRLAGTDASATFAKNLRRLSDSSGLGRLARGEKPPRQPRMTEREQIESGDWNTEVPFWADPTQWPTMIGPGAGLVRPSMRIGEVLAARILGPRAASRAGVALADALGAGLTGAEYSALSDIAEGNNPLPNLPVAAAGGMALGGIVGGVRPTSQRVRPVPTTKAPATAAPEAAPPESMTRTGPATGAKVEQVFKTDKFALPEDSPELATVNRAFASLGLGTRRVRSFDDMRRAAEELGVDPKRLLSGAMSRPISDAEVVATSNLVNQQSEIHSAAVKALENPALTTPERMALQRQANESWTQLTRAIGRSVRGGTESGRAVTAYRIIANRNLDPSYWYSVAQRQLGDRPFTPEIKASLDAAIGSQDRFTLAQIVGKLRTADWADKLSTLAKAFMLSNPGTDVRNVGGNIASAVFNGIADLPAATLDWMASRVTGQRTKAFPSLAKLSAGASGVRSGVRQAGEILRYGDTVDCIMSKYDFSHQTHFDHRALEFGTQLIFRRLGMEDVLFRAPQRSMALAELAEVTAKNEGLKGRALLSRMQELIANPTEKMSQLADESAAYRTFNKESRLASGIQALERQTGLAGKMIGTAVFPFKRTPINVAEMVVDFSPFGIPKTAVRWAANRKGDAFLRQRYLVEGLSRPITGLGIVGLGWALARAGLATGGPGNRQSDKNYRRALEIPDYSVKLGDTWVSINNNAPTSNLLMLGVDAAEQFNTDRKLSDKVAGAAFAGVKGLTQQTFMTGVRSASEAATDPGRYGGNWLEGVAGMVVPSILGAVARGTDPHERRVEGPGQAIMARIPGLRQTLEPQVTFAGEARRQKTGVVGQVLSPVRFSGERSDIVARAIRSSGYAPGVTRGVEVTRRGKKITLSEQQRTRYQMDMGRAQEEAIRRVASSPNFFRLDPERQAYLMESAVRSRQQAVSNRWRNRLFSNGR